MKNFLHIITIYLFVTGISVPIYAQVNNCANLNFANGNFDNWTGYTWKYSWEHPEVNSLPVEGLVSPRHKIMTDITAYDENTNFQLKKIPYGYQYSARLGDIIPAGCNTLNPSCWNQSLRYDIDVSESNNLLILKYALVLEYASGHDNSADIYEPRFYLTLFDSNGDTIDDCANYIVYASNESINGFTFITSDAGDQVMWRDWTTVGVDLDAYRGQTVTVEFVTADCAETCHFGYGYFVAECQPRDISVKDCGEDTIAVLKAPPGFESYTWRDDSDKTIDTLQVMILEDFMEGTKYSCDMVSETGCELTLSSTPYNYNPKAAFGDSIVDCITNEVQFMDSSTTNRGNLVYLWDYHDGEFSYEGSHKYAFETSGMHSVTLVVISPESGCSDTLTKDVESFAKPLVGISGDSTYCPGGTATIEPYGAYRYEWNTGIDVDSMVIGAPGGDFWMLGYSSTNCISDTIKWSIIEEPYWEVNITGDTVVCEGEPIELTGQGAVSYLWNTGDTSQSITVDTNTVLTVQGINKRGCIKNDIQEVYYSMFPKAEFTMSDSVITNRDSDVYFETLPEESVSYTWQLGDSSTENRLSFSHSYKILSKDLYYTVLLSATNSLGCQAVSTDIINIIPFVPNIFTPNNDGVNDRFMEGLYVEVFDRHGALIFKGSEGWDGNYRGRPVDPDTYFYLVKYSNRFGKEILKRGYLTLVK